MIGHNNPPPSEAMAMHVDDLLQLVSDTCEGAEVKTDEQEEALADLLKQVNQSKKDAENTRKEEKQPHLDAGRAVDKTWKPVIAKCTAAANEIKGKLTPYREAKEAAKQEAIAKARAEAEAKERAAQEALQSESLTERVQAESELAQAKALRVASNKAERAATGLRTQQVAVVTDYRALLLHIAATDKPALDAWLDEYARKALPAQLPGVRIDTERKAA